MNPTQFIQDLRKAGYQLRLDEDKILVSGGEIDDDLRATIKANKRHFVTALQKENERKKKVSKMLADNPNLDHACYVDDSNPDPDYHIVALAVRDEHGGATSELLIPRAKVDIWQLMEFIQQRGQVQNNN